MVLYQKIGEQLFNAAAADAKVREQVIGILSQRMLSERAVRVNDALQAGRAKDLIPQMTPAETFFLGTQFRQKFPNEAQAMGDPGKELDALAASSPADVSIDRLSHDFGVPHPTLELSYSRELLNVKPFPAFMGFPSRMLAETWDSGNLYWARIADDMNLSPETLNTLIPQLTHRMVEKIFATDFEDWPAVLRAMHETGDEFRRGENASASNSAGGGHLGPLARRDFDFRGRRFAGVAASAFAVGSYKRKQWRDDGTTSVLSCLQLWSRVRLAGCTRRINKRLLSKRLPRRHPRSRHKISKCRQTSTSSSTWCS